MVQGTLRALKNQGKTLIIIAHRLSTVAFADEIFVLEKGKLIEQGSHNELLKNKDGKYADLWNKQTLVIE